MPLTRVTEVVFDTPISIIAKPNAIPKATAAGVLDSSWGVGTGGGGGGTGDMSKSTYDTNNNGKVDKAEAADKISVTSTANKIWGTNASNNQVWIDPVTIPRVATADSASQITGNPAANKLWGTNSVGVQTWLDMLNGDMSRSIYDTNGNGRVDYAELADGLNNPIANRIWGTTNSGTQQWIDINPTDIMKKSVYGEGTGITAKVQNAVVADTLSSALGASSNTVLLKNALGNLEWASITSVISGDIMSKSIYDLDGDGIVDAAEEATKISSSTTAGNRTFYGKDSLANVGFFSIVDVEPDVMLKSSYSTSGSINIVDHAEDARNIYVEPTDTIDPGDVYGLMSDGEQGFGPLSDFLNLAGVGLLKGITTNTIVMPNNTYYLPAGSGTYNAYIWIVTGVYMNYGPGGDLGDSVAYTTAGVGQFVVSGHSVTGNNSASVSYMCISWD